MGPAHLEAQWLVHVAWSGSSRDGVCLGGVQGGGGGVLGGSGDSNSSDFGASSTYFGVS